MMNRMSTPRLSSGPRGLALLAAHCAALDPDAPSARERLANALGAELAHRLVFALSSAGAEPGSAGRARFAA
jgi:hypothetical protein